MKIILLLTILIFGYSFLYGTTNFNYEHRFNYRYSDTLKKESQKKDRFLNSVKIDTASLKLLQKYDIDLTKIDCEEFYGEIVDWLGVPYKYGGNSKRGVDCSRLVIRLSRGLFYDSICGSSESISNMVQEIKPENLCEGDLVFFKINKNNVSHVGLYLQNGLFIHATRKKGVTISSLTEKYYQRYFHSSGRIINN